MPPTLYLIDGHALAYRMYFALTGSGGGFSTSQGEPTAGTYGFAMALLRLLEKEQPEYLAIAFDTGKTFRDELYSEYKATRAKMPDDLRQQIERIRQMVDVFGFPRLELEGFEADDVLGSVARQAAGQGFGVKIITGDKDLLQLVDERVIVNLPGKKVTEVRDFTPQKVVEYLGIRPDQVVDYKAMAGDSSDNIPGVAGVGDKTATKLLQQYDNLDQIYAHLEELPTRARNCLSNDREAAYLSKELATIRTDVKITLDLDDANISNLNLRAAEELFRELEFTTLVSRLRKISAGPAAAAPGQQLTLFGDMPMADGEAVSRVGDPPDLQIEVHTIDTPEALQKLTLKLEAASRISFDTETTSTDPLRADLVGISLAVEEGEGYYIPLGHNTGEPQLEIPVVLQSLRPSFTDPAIGKTGHNLKYDCLVLDNHGLMPSPLSFDTMIAGWLISPGARRFGLKDMADIYLSISMTHIEELIGKGKKQISMADVPVEKVAPYAAADAEVPLRLQTLLQKRLDKGNATALMSNLEMPLIPVLINMEKEGIALDAQFFEKMSAELTHRLREIEDSTYQSVGTPFNLNSTQQLSDVLFGTLGLQSPRKKKTASGHFSTAADVLEQLRGQHPVVDWILEHRELAKLKSTYVDALPQQINPSTGRVHTSFSQTGSVTGRLASSNPNLQNIPARTEIGRRVRKGFIAAEGHQLLAVDYSQIELRIVAHMSGDKSMLDAFRAGQDIHAATAAAVLGAPLDQITKDQRRHAKAINFGLIYGMSAFGLTRTTDLTLAESENFVKAYFEQFPGVKQYLDDLRSLAARQGYVETLLGRRRYFPNLSNPANSVQRQREEREAINAPIQGTAADIMKIAMIQLPNALKDTNLSVRLLLQVHDELLLECRNQELHETARLVCQVMENACSLSIPLLTEARSGASWGDLTVLDLP